ncbi:trichodiene oxygenase [Periconia macrospinosa]|uniref:Trichodiene oxygenase n=1 Tax=Periconia macrospinosa TaxID=97972 RepID=A0A2V1E1T7_9PLEO|nr:trichodiene oxygenase [Periconia macrospinosa]
MASFISWQMCAGAAIAYYATLVFYRLFLHPLAAFPGPKLAAISRWYEAYYDIVRGGQYTSQIAQLHRVYGPIVRISPHELHISDPAFFETLYRNDGRWHKYAWTYDAFGAPNSTIFGSNHEAHKAHRRAIAPFFSKQHVMARQAILRRNMDKLCRRISNLSGTPFNLGAAISAFMRDNANEFILGKEYNEIDLDDFGVLLSIGSAGMGPIWRMTKHVPWFGPALKSIPPKWVMKVADEGTKSFFKYIQQCEKDTRNTLAAAELPFPDPWVKDTMVHTILHSDLPAAEKSFLRIFDEVATVTAAAFDTTANAMRLILFHVYANADILQRLRDEVTAAQPSSSEPIPLKTLEQLPYLTAVLMEGMRLSPAISTRAARITDKDLIYGAWRIPAGTPVGMTTLLMHTDENIYPDPMRFHPDRWLQSATRVATPASTYAPFLRGTRMCLGLHLAWAEMYLVLATLVQRFSFKIEGVTAADFELDCDNFGIGTKAGCNLMTVAKPVEN